MAIETKIQRIGVEMQKLKIHSHRVGAKAPTVKSVLYSSSAPRRQMSRILLILASFEFSEALNHTNFKRSLFYHSKHEKIQRKTLLEASKH